MISDRRKLSPNIELAISNFFAHDAAIVFKDFVQEEVGHASRNPQKTYFDQLLVMGQSVHGQYGGKPVTHQQLWDSVQAEYKAWSDGLILYKKPVEFDEDVDDEDDLDTLEDITRRNWDNPVGTRFVEKTEQHVDHYPRFANRLWSFYKSTYRNFPSPVDSFSEYVDLLKGTFNSAAQLRDFFEGVDAIRVFNHGFFKDFSAKLAQWEDEYGLQIGEDLSRISKSKKITNLVSNYINSAARLQERLAVYRGQQANYIFGDDLHGVNFELRQIVPAVHEKSTILDSDGENRPLL